MRARLVVCAWACAMLAGCNGKDPSNGECAEATIPENNATVVVLTFDTDGDSTSHVEFSVAGGETRTTPTDEPSTHHEQLLLGIPPETDVAYTITIDEGGNQSTCEGTIRTGRVPPTFPPFEVTIDEPDKYVEPYLLIAFVQDPKVLAVIDRQGHVLWYMYADELVPWAETFPEFHPGIVDDLQIIHATLWPERKQLVYNLQALEGDVGSILWTNWAKEDLRAEVAPLSHHAFALNHETGTVTYIGLDVRDWFDPDEGKKVSVVGDRFVDLDADGNQTELFSTWDHFEVVKNPRHWDVPFYPQGHDWTHGNATNFFPERNAFLFSFANTNTFMEWSYDTGPGEVFTWSDWQVGENTTPFTFQHDPRWTEGDKISLTTTADLVTRGVVYELDFPTQTYTEVWSHGDGAGYDTVTALALGENHLLSNGNRLINFGAGAILREVTPDDEVVWELKGLPVDIWIGSVQPFSDFYAYE